jgi:hypothetical protein
VASDPAHGRPALARVHPQDWRQQRARATFCGGRDGDIAPVRPIPRIEPRDSGARWKAIPASLRPPGT